MRFSTSARIAFSAAAGTASSRCLSRSVSGRPIECRISQDASSTALLVPWPKEIPARSNAWAASPSRSRTVRRGALRVWDFVALGRLVPVRNGGTDALLDVAPERRAGAEEEEDL